MKIIDETSRVSAPKSEAYAVIFMFTNSLLFTEQNLTFTKQNGLSKSIATVIIIPLVEQ